MPQKIQPIVITPNKDARYLIEDVFVGSSCFGVTNMSVTGMPGQVGTFAQGSATVGIVDLNVVISVPNAFSPLLSDGINDRFTVFVRPEMVSQFKLLRIFDRWGGIVFERLNFPPNDEREGWDGSFRGRSLSPGVFTWYTELELIDGSPFNCKEM